jgi:methylated-DNA-[protein]-cysteine S-methyltransferase
MNNIVYYYTQIESPVGKLKLVARGKCLVGILWHMDDMRPVPWSTHTEDRAHPVLVETERQLNEYFDGRRKAFSLKLEFAGTEFQNAVWRASLTIPYGETRTYGQIANQVGNARAMRAVGSANRENPIAIVVPVHRVVAAAGRPTGSGFGLDARSFLLTLESDNTDQTQKRKNLGRKRTSPE